MRIPSLVDLCIQSAIDNIQYIGDVGETDTDLLKVILPHCSSDQLMFIEDSSEGRDLSPITDGIWRQFYERRFGSDNVNVVIKRMKQNRVSFKWRLLYEAKLKEQQQIQQKSLDRLKQLYAKAGVEKKSKQIQLCSTIPPVSRKRKFTYGGSGSSINLSNTKGRLMKKAKVEYLTSYEAQIHATINKNSLQAKRLAPQEGQIHATINKNSLQAKRLAPQGRASNVSMLMSRRPSSMEPSVPMSLNSTSRGSNPLVKGSVLPRRLAL